MKIRYDLLENIERLVLLENSIKDKLNDMQKYKDNLELIIQIKTIMKAFDFIEISTYPEYRGAQGIKGADELAGYFSKLELLKFHCKYKESTITFTPITETKNVSYNKLDFISYIGKPNLETEYFYAIDYVVDNGKYSGKVVIEVPKREDLITKEILDKNVKKLRTNVDIVLDQVKLYETNRDILLNY